MAAKERVCWICMLSISYVLGWSVFCWADFYVIATGKRAKKTVLVSPKSTETASGEALLNALAQISLSSESNPYLIIIEPGVYDIGGESLQMKSYVDMQGSGQNVTKITGNIGFASTAVLRGANNAELRFLTVENTGGGTFAEAIYNSSQSPVITNVTATASGGSYFTAGIHNYNSSCVMTNVTASASGGGADNRGVFNLLGTPVMAHVTASASGGTYNYGVYNSATTPEMKDVTAWASGGTTSIGVNNDGCSFTMTEVTATADGGTNSYGVSNSSGSSILRIDHSVISGTTNSVFSDAGSTTFVGNTRLDGPTGGTATTICAGVHDESYNFYASTCP